MEYDICINWNVHEMGSETELIFWFSQQDKEYLQNMGFVPCSRFCLFINPEYVEDPMNYIIEMRNNIIQPMICGKKPENINFIFSKHD